MTKYILVLSICLLFLLSLTAVFLLTTNKISFDQSNSSTPFGLIKPSPTPIINNSLSFSPIDQTILPGQINSLNIILQSQDSGKEVTPNTIQLEIAYDPLAISNISIQSGDFFHNPTILINTINQRSGRISYALEKSPTDTTIRALGTVATISFIPNINFTNNYSPIKFLEKTLIRGKNGENILTSTTSANLIFNK